MSTFYTSFDNDLSAFSFYPVDGYTVYRNWWVDNGVLKTQDGVAYRPGFLIADVSTPPTVNRTISASHIGLDEYNGCDNHLIIKYMDNTHFHGLRLNPGVYDQKGIYFSTDNTNQWQGQGNALAQGDVKIPLYRPDGFPLASEVWPNKTDLPNDGTVVCEISNGYNFYVAWYNSTGSLVASGTHVDTTYDTCAGYAGFFHTDKWNANIFGWGDFTITSGTSGTSGVGPEIIYLSADNLVITSGSSTDLDYLVSSGSDTTTAWFDNGVGVVPLSGSTTVSPTVTTTYTLSAWNTYGTDVDDIEITVISTSSDVPEIIVLSAISPVALGTSAEVGWITSGCVSAFFKSVGTDNFSFWLDTSAISAGTFHVSAMNGTNGYILYGYGAEGSVVWKTTQIDPVFPPQIWVFSASPNPVCSGADFDITFKTRFAVSAFIDNGVGWFNLPDTNDYVVSSTTTSADLPTTYGMSAWNPLGTIMVSSLVQSVYYRDPVADPGLYQIESFSATSGTPITFNASASYDPDGGTIDSYLWTSSGDTWATTESFTSAISGAGLHNFELTVWDNCGQSASAPYQVYLASLFPPVAIASATPQLVAGGQIFNLDGSQSYDPDGSIAEYYWDLSGAFVASAVSADTSQLVNGQYTYTLTVTDTSGLSASDDVTVFVEGIFSPSANAGEDQAYCIPAGTSASDVFLDGTGSLDPQVGGTISWYEWDLSAFGVPNVSATVSAVSDIYTTVSGVSGTGSFVVGLEVSATNGLTDTDETIITLTQQPSVSAGGDYSVAAICDYAYQTVTFSGDSDTSGVQYVWTFDDGDILYGQQVQKEYTAGEYSATLEVYTTGTPYQCGSVVEEFNITVDEKTLNIPQFKFIPNVISVQSGVGNTTLYWETLGATSAFIDNSVGWLDSSDVSAGTLAVSADENITYTMSAFDSSGCVRTRTAFASVHIGVLSACLLKQNYITIYAPDHLRWGGVRDINLTLMLPNRLDGTETSQYVEVFEDYMNEMYPGKDGYVLSANELSVTACGSSACLISAVDNQFAHDQFDGVSGVSANAVETPSNDVDEIYVDNLVNCIRPRENISVLEKIYRLTELFDPDLIPIELIQFYANNLGYDVGLSRNNVGFDGILSAASTGDLIDQNKYLRFMVRNLPTWYKIKTTRNAVKMMLYSFGLVGDFIYYFTRDYKDPTTGIGIDTLEYGGQSPNGYSVTNPDGYTYAFPENMTSKELAELKCSATEWEQFKQNRTKYLGMLVEIQQAEKDDNWILTDVNLASVDEDITNIPDGFFPTPHFRLWFDVLESMTNGNLATDLKRQELISEAIRAIKPINTVFEGITGVFEEFKTIYAQPYVRIRKHITMVSDGNADYWNE